MTTFYAVANANGPISVRIEAESAAEAREWFETQETNFVDDCRTDAEDDLGVCGEGMSDSEFHAVMESSGCEVVDRDITGDHNWQLWVRAIAVGDRVEGGEGEDHDTGIVDEISGNMASVRWDSLVVTDAPLSLLRKI